RELDLFLGDALLEKATPPGEGPLDELFLPPPAFEWPEPIAKLVTALRDPSKLDEKSLPRGPRTAVAVVRALAAFAVPAPAPKKLVAAASALGDTGVEPEQALAIALAEKHAAKLAPAERRRHYRAFGRGLDEAGRATVENALAELAGLDRL